MKQILVVDDEKSIRTTLQAFLSEEGYEVQVAEDVDQATELLQAIDFDVVVTDIILPRMTGVDLLKSLKEISPQSKVIMMTGEPTVETSAESLRFGAFDYLFKPIAKERILQTVHNALSAKKLEDDKKQLEEENERHREELESLVEERTAELVKKNKQLRQAQKMEAIGTLAGGIAHDFNNILSAILGFTELSKMKLDSKSDVQADLDEIFKAGKRAKDLVVQILTFSRQSDQELSPIIIHPVVSEALKLLRSSLPTTIEIIQDIHKCGTVMADATQIHQVVMNLCTNAYHAMQKKDGELKVTLMDTHLGVDDVARYPELKPGPYVYLTVSDTGHGMNPSTVQRIFDPYFTTKEKGVGTGMGLSVVHGIIEAHEGFIRVESEIGKGSTFHVYLPRVKYKSPEKTDIDKPLPRGDERILFVDDEKALINIGKQMLEKLGYKVQTKQDSKEALSLFASAPEKFDLVITDMTMPHLTGEKLARKLMEVRPDIPIILCTGYSDRISEQKVKQMGIRAFIMKPIAISILANTVRKVLDETRR